jgi:hypothetical protein
MLTGARYDELNSNVFSGSASTSTLVNQLKSLESYKKNKSSSGIEIYYGSLTRA